MRTVAKAFAAFLVGCLHPLPPVPPPPAGYCTTVPRDVSNQDVCDGMFTTDGHGYACVKCGSGVSGCVDKVDQVYCVTDCSDPACGKQ